MNGEKCTVKRYIPLYKVRLIKDGSVLADRKIVKVPDDAYQIMRGYFDGLACEHFVALMLNTKNHVIGIAPISVGSINATIVHPRELFIPLIQNLAASAILLHNHVSGDPSPSPEDLSLTSKLVECSRQLDISLLDHLIMGDGCYVSLKEQGVL